jgi:hypothetical protein
MILVLWNFPQNRRARHACDRPRREVGSSSPKPLAANGAPLTGGFGVFALSV